MERKTLKRMVAGVISLACLIFIGVLFMGSYQANPYTAGLTSGTQVSSTYEGRHITILESNCTHYDGDGDGLIEKGDPVIVGDEGLVGVSFRSATAGTDYIVIDTEGIWNLPIVNAAVMPIGDRVYIRTDTGRLNDAATTSVPFGWVLVTINTSNTAVVVPIKVHCD